MSSAGHTAAETREHLLRLLGPVVTAAGYDLEDVTVSQAGRRKLVRVIVDRDGGIDLDAVAEVTHAVSDLLDSDGPGGGAFAGPFVLEVSSPGVDRPLSEARHWRRAVGRLVEVTAAGAPVVGRVRSVTDTGIVLAVDGTDRDIAWADLGRGVVQVEFSRGEG